MWVTIYGLWELTSVRRTSMIMKSVAAAFVVITSYKASGDMLDGRERGSGNERAQVGVGFGCGSIQCEGK